MEQTHYLVPQQNAGSEKDITHSAEGRSVEDAEDWFVDGKERLLDVNNWERYAQGLPVAFHLADGHGKPLNRRARRGDHIRIDASGGNMEEGSFDWATIEAMEYDDYPDDSIETFAIRLRPAAHPQYSDTAALLQGSDASGTFVIARRGKKIFATYHGRNELALIPAGPHGADDTDEVPACWLGLSDDQWTDLMKGLLK